tara:strand:- start:161 stop:580 length:420 start_codon:yes stop_codon:yes gene_type:complete
MSLDLSYLFHTTIDIENYKKLLKTSLSKNTTTTFPHYNIIKLDNNYFRVSLALAGFSKNNVEILVEDNVLIIKSAAADVDKTEYLYKGIANRSFQKKFQLAKNVKVDNAFFENGLLNIDLLQFEPKKKVIMKVDIKSND